MPGHLNTFLRMKRSRDLLNRELSQTRPFGNHVSFDDVSNHVRKEVSFSENKVSHFQNLEKPDVFSCSKKKLVDSTRFNRNRSNDVPNRECARLCRKNVGYISEDPNSSASMEIFDVEKSVEREFDHFKFPKRSEEEASNSKRITRCSKKPKLPGLPAIDGANKQKGKAKEQLIQGNITDIQTCIEKDFDQFDYNQWQRKKARSKVLNKDGFVKNVTPRDTNLSSGENKTNRKKIVGSMTNPSSTIVERQYKTINNTLSNYCLRLPSIVQNYQICKPCDKTKCHIVNGVSLPCVQNSFLTSQRSTDESQQ